MRAMLTGFGVLVLALALAPAGAAAATRYVAPNGAGTACTPAAPCRTIGAAIAVAAAGDRIVVAPGLYGDVDADGAFTSPGDEPAPAGGCGCVILVDKPLTLESSAGAGATIIVAAGGTDSVIHIVADDVVIGRRDRGFTIRGGVRGVLVENPGARLESNDISGASFSGATTSHGTAVVDNVVHDNGTVGLDIQGIGDHVAGNTVVSNGVGIVLVGSGHVVSGNIVVGNRFSGLEASGPTTSSEISTNSFVRNRGAGLLVQPGIAGDYAGLVITANNVFGNGLVTDHNCGIDNQHSELVTAERNYWGAATGPGADPADATCGTVDAVPFATRAVTVVNDAGR